MNFGAWLRNQPRILERVYNFAFSLFSFVDPIFKRINYSRVERFIKPAEEFTKKIVFDCKMCGQCILHSTGMTCPMTCPKNLRNGPCGGVRLNGNCEVKPDMRCVWVEAYKRSLEMTLKEKELEMVQPPVNRQLADRSAWVTLFSGEDQQVAPGWE